jgi:two-component system LytT family response regulator
MKTINSIESRVIEIKTDKGFKIISNKKILIIKANKKKSIIHVDGSELIKSFNSLKWFSQKLKPPDFFRCHNSFIINCHLVDCFSTKGITLKGNIIVPLTRNKLPELENILAELQRKI